MISPVRASVYINEFSSFESSGDWIELYADTETDISGWILKDLAGEMKVIPPEVKIGTPSGAIYVINVSNRLNRDSDNIELYLADQSTLVDSVSYGFDDSICAGASGNSVGRSLDGITPWVRFMVPTQFLPNGGDESPCPTPSPIPSPSTIPTPSPHPSPRSLSPTPSESLPSPVPKASLKPSPSPDLGVSPPGTVAGETSVDLSVFGSRSPTPSLNPSSVPSGLQLNRNRAKIVLTIGVGLLISSGAGLALYQRHSQQV